MRALTNNISSHFSEDFPLFSNIRILLGIISEHVFIWGHHRQLSDLDDMPEEAERVDVMREESSRSDRVVEAVRSYSVDDQRLNG
jgi:hypothetical protein